MASAPISAARNAAVVSGGKYGLPVPAAEGTMRPFSRGRLGRSGMTGPRTRAMAIAGRTRVACPPPCEAAGAGLGGLGGGDLGGGEAAGGGVRGDAGEELGDGLLRVPDEGLLGEDVVLEEPVEAALDDLGDGLLGLALVAGEVLVDGAFLVEDVAGDVVSGEVPGGRGRDVEGDVVRDLPGVGGGGVDAADLDEGADCAAPV